MKTPEQDQSYVFKKYGIPSDTLMTHLAVLYVKSQGTQLGDGIGHGNNIAIDLPVDVDPDKSFLRINDREIAVGELVEDLVSSGEAIIVPPTDVSSLGLIVQLGEQDKRCVQAAKESRQDVTPHCIHCVYEYYRVACPGLLGLQRTYETSCPLIPRTLPRNISDGYDERDDYFKRIT